jgi:hypothetical protein
MIFGGFAAPGHPNANPQTYLLSLWAYHCLAMPV